jgi:hypothetical protein
MFHLWLITGILGYARKIPIINKIVTLTSLWYGKSTWFKLLIKIRKLFVIFNALIGVYVVFKSIGFSTDNIISGFSALGHEYFNILYNFTTRLYNWFYNLFNNKIVPDVPSKPSYFNPGSYKYFPRGIDYGLDYKIPKIEKPTFSLRELYIPKDNNFVINTPTSWYKDTTTWLYIISIAASIGVGYLGYKIYTDPLYLASFFISDLTPKQGPIDPTSPGPDIELHDTRSTLAETVGNGIGIVTKPFRYVTNKLNPFNYILSASDSQDQFMRFMDRQNDYLRADRRFYPFTDKNPFDSFSHKMKILFLGESASESFERFRIRHHAERVYNSLSVNTSKYPDMSPLLSGLSTPNV